MILGKSNDSMININKVYYGIPPSLHNCFIRFTNDNPQASKERVDGSVFRLAYEAKLRKNQIEQVILIFRIEN